MAAILNSENANSFPIFQPILMKLVSKFMVDRALCLIKHTYDKGCGPLYSNIQR